MSAVRAIPLCTWAALQAIAAHAVPLSPQSVLEAVFAKGDRTVSPFNIGESGVSVELADHPRTVITVRNTDGSLLYRVDPIARAANVAKRTSRAGTIPTTARVKGPVVRLPLPDGCESAFSPYAAPDKADVVGRSIS